MDKLTEELIIELAQKLGTTAVHLWEVLIRQAIILSLADIIVIAGWVYCLVLMYRFIEKKTKMKDSKGFREWDEEYAFIAWIIFAIVIVIFVIIVGISIGAVIGGIINPEYWALKQLIKN